MNNIGFFIFKFINRYYVEQKEKELKELEIKKEKLLRAINEEKEIISQRKMELDKENKENAILKQQYNKAKSSLLNRGILLDVNNNNYDVKEWDNLFLYKKSSKYLILSKNKEVIYTLEDDICSLIEEISKENYGLSIIAIRVNKNNIKIQIRFIEE